MRSVDADDATTRSRIRDAAIRLFGRDGYRATTLRAVAAEVGVSAALVIHHFGSKEALRAACDDFILAEVAREAGAIGSGGPATSSAIRAYFANLDLKLPWIDYLTRQFTEPSELGDRFFDQFVEYTEGMFAAGVADGSVRESADPHMRAVILTAYGLSSLAFARHIGRATGEVGLTPAAAARMAIPSLEIYTHGVYTTDALLRATEDALEPGSPVGPPPTKGPNE